jgi:hypothetical protein
VGQALSPVVFLWLTIEENCRTFSLMVLIFF